MVLRRIAIVQGEHVVVAEPDVMVTTLLGSCVAVCLHDAEARVGGMNHFLLGAPDPAHLIRGEDMHRYGVHAMELLINAMMHKGAVRDRMRAHVYGGATIIAALGGIGSENARFALGFLRAEGIAVGRSEIGGTAPRRVEFLPWQGQVRSFAVVQEAPPLLPLPVLPGSRSVAGGDADLPG